MCVRKGQTIMVEEKDQLKDNLEATSNDIKENAF